MSHQKVYPTSILIEEDIDINYFNYLICLQEIFWLDLNNNIGEHSDTLKSSWVGINLPINFCFLKGIPIVYLHVIFYI